MGPLFSAAERLGQLLRSNNMESAMWADSVIKQRILAEPVKYLPFPYMKRPYDRREQSAAATFEFT